MRDKETYLYGEKSENLQMPYDEYIDLKGKVDEAQRLEEVKETVLADLQRFLAGGIADEPLSIPEQQAEPEPMPEQQPEPLQQPEPTAEQQPELPQQPEPTAEQQPEPTAEPEPEQAQQPEPTAEPEPIAEQQHEPLQQSEPMSEQQNGSEPTAEQQAEPEPTQQQPVSNARADVSEVPPIKNEIAEHFNKFDDSGRLFSVFKQYYTCLNEECGGTVRVTMKDGFCSLWNYDEWEEFAFVDVFEGLLRISIDPRYTDALKSLCLCEAPRLISSRRNVICVQVDDLNNTALNVLTKAFSEVGMQVK